jgi:hypothetical protein
MTINQGDIVRSNGRIATMQEGRRRFAEFDGALVLDVEDSNITVSPIGKRAKLVCQDDDLHIAKAAAQESTPAAKPATPSLKRLQAEPEPVAKETPKRRAPAKKKPAARRRRTS